MQLTRTRQTMYRATQVGLEWHITDLQDKKIVWHNGLTAGHYSFIGFDPMRRAGVVILADTANAMNEIGLNLLSGVAGISAIL